MLTPIQSHRINFFSGHSFHSTELVQAPGRHKGYQLFYKDGEPVAVTEPR